MLFPVDQRFFGGRQTGVSVALYEPEDDKNGGPAGDRASLQREVKDRRPVMISQSAKFFSFVALAGVGYLAFSAMILIAVMNREPVLSIFSIPLVALGILASYRANRARREGSDAR
jgi:hypothetical protein